jgi:CRISPR/Cas system Type II protein with McrA/HNH and RuvC-like nuclease domain
VTLVVSEFSEEGQNKYVIYIFLNAPLKALVVIEVVKVKEKYSHYNKVNNIMVVIRMSFTKQPIIIVGEPIEKKTGHKK